jgi:hypothetical protein
MKINKSIVIRSILSFLIISILSNCSFLNVLAPSPYQRAYDKNGRALLKDSILGREDFVLGTRINIRNELANNRVPGTKDSRDWQTFWMKRFYFIRKDSENPRWYINYIIETRRTAGLPALR